MGSVAAVLEDLAVALVVEILPGLESGLGGLVVEREGGKGGEDVRPSSLVSVAVRLEF